MESRATQQIRHRLEIVDKLQDLQQDYSRKTNGRKKLTVAEAALMLDIMHSPVTLERWVRSAPLWRVAVKQTVVRKFDPGHRYYGPGKRPISTSIDNVKEEEEDDDENDHDTEITAQSDKQHSKESRKARSSNSSMSVEEQIETRTEEPQEEFECAEASEEEEKLEDSNRHENNKAVVQATGLPAQIDSEGESSPGGSLRFNRRKRKETLDNLVRVRTRVGTKEDELRYLYIANELRRYYLSEKAPVIQELRFCSSSFFVLLFQRAFETHLERIHSEPHTLEEETVNLEIVVKALSQILEFDDLAAFAVPSKIVLEGDVEAIAALLDVFFEVHRAVAASSSSSSSFPQSSQSEDHKSASEEVEKEVREAKEEEQSEHRSASSEAAASAHQDSATMNTPLPLSAHDANNTNNNDKKLQSSQHQHHQQQQQQQQQPADASPSSRASISTENITCDLSSIPPNHEEQQQDDQVRASSKRQDRQKKNKNNNILRTTTTTTAFTASSSSSGAQPSLYFWVQPVQDTVSFTPYWHAFKVQVTNTRKHITTTQDPEQDLPPRIRVTLDVDLDDVLEACKEKVERNVKRNVNALSAKLFTFYEPTADDDDEVSEGDDDNDDADHHTTGPVGVGNLGTKPRQVHQTENLARYHGPITKRSPFLVIFEDFVVLDVPMAAL